MSSIPLLFDLGSHRPTTRDIARTVKQGGTTALTEAERGADQARYQEVTCRSALNRVEGMPFNWTLNPYRGCTHLPGQIRRAGDIEIADHDVGTGIGKASHDRGTNALRPARDEGAAAVEPPERPGAGGRHA